MSADEIIVRSVDKNIEIKKSKPLLPAIMMSYGLPLRLETSLRFMPKRFFDGILRFQVNPPSFDLIDCSINTHYGYIIDSYSYLKYGITISKNIHEYEPYLNYSLYKFVNTQGHDLTGGILTGATQNFIDDNRSLGFGIGIPLRKAKLFPELNYQHYGKEYGNGIIHFGVGFRLYLN